MRKIAMLAFTACAACSLLVDTDDLDKPAAGPRDGGPDSTTIVPAEASITIQNEAGTDTSSVTSRFCASHANALLCDDFDQPNRTDLRTEGWTPTFGSYPMGAPTTAQFFSPPQSARIVWDSADAGVPGRAGASRTVGVPTSVSAVTIWLRVRPELTLAADEQIVAVSLRSCVVFATSNFADMLWQENREGIGGFNIPFEKWSLIAFTIKVRKDGCDTTVVVGEGAAAIVLPTKTMNITPTGDLPSLAAIDLGYTGHDTVGAVSFDDVLFVAGP